MTRARPASVETAESAARRPSLDATEDEIIAEFAGLADLTAKYEHLVRLGRELRAPEEVRSPDYSVTGCQSRVWIRTALQDGRLRIAADSDAMIVRGLIALLLRILDDRAPAEIAAAELRTFDATGLRAHLSPLRSNGLAAMVKRIREDAEAAAGTA